MRHRALLLLACALAFGLASVVLAHQWLTRRPAVAAVTPPAAPTVVVARAALPAGTRLTADQVEAVPWPSGHVPPGSFPHPDQLFAGTIPPALLRPLEAGEPVLAAKLAGPDSRATLSALIGSERRAVTIRVNDVLGVAGFVLPGDRVDILLTRDLGKDRPVTDVLLQSVKVLGVDQEANERKDKPMVARAVTLEVTPEEAQRITLGTQVGTLTLALRNLADTNAAPVGTVGLADLGPATPPPPRATGGNHATIRVVRGTTAGEVHVVRDTPRP